MISTIVKIILNENLIEEINSSIIENMSGEVATKFSSQSPTFGISAGTGVIKFKDVNKKFLNYSQLGLLTTNVPIEIYVKNMLNNKEELAGVWTSSNWGFDVDNKVVTVSLRDNISDLQKIEEPSTLSLIPIKNNTISAMKLFYYFYGGEYQGETFVGVTPKNIEFDDFDLDVVERLEAITIEKPYIPATSLWGYYDILCQISMLCMYKNTNGKIKLDIIE